MPDPQAMSRTRLLLHNIDGDFIGYFLFYSLNDFVTTQVGIIEASAPKVMHLLFVIRY